MGADALYGHLLRHLERLAGTDEPADLRVMLDGSTDLMGAVATLQTRLMSILRRAERAKDLSAAFRIFRALKIRS